MDVSLLIRLIDQASGPAKKIADGLRGVGTVADEMRKGFGDAIRQGFSVDNIDAAIGNAEAAMERARGRLIGAVGMALTLAAPVVKSAQFDQSMRGLDKVLDVTHSRLQQLRKFALDTSAIVPIAAGSLVELMAEAAQGGVPEEELEAFSLYVAKAAVAFDMAGAEIGERFAKLRNVYKLNQEGIENLGDATNHLSNKMAAKASEITDFANRAAGAAKTLNLTAVEMAAVGAAMIAAGIAPETAARGLSALANRVTAGGKQVDKAFKMIGMSRKEFQKALAADGPAALQKLFETMSKSPKGMEALIALVGQDFSDDFSKFLGNPELLAQALKLIADQADYAGSATEEAAKQAEGAEKRWELLRNKLDRVAIQIGDKLLPVVFLLQDAIGDMLDKVSAWIDANPELAAGLAQAVAGLIAFSIASRLLAFGIAAMRLPLLRLLSGFLKFDGTGRNVSRGWRLLAGSGRMLASALRGIVRNVPALRNAAAGFAMLAAVTRGGAIGAAFVGLGSAIGTVGAALATITAPVWLVIAALAAGAYLAWRFWDHISSFASGVASVLGPAFSKLVGYVGDAIDSFIDFNARVFGIDPGAVDRFKATLRDAFDFSEWIETAQAKLADWWANLGSIFSGKGLTDGEKSAMFAAGQRFGQSIIDGLKSMFGAIGDLLTFDLKINWPEPPEWLLWMMEQHRNAAAAVKEAASNAWTDWSNYFNGTEEEPGAQEKVRKTVSDISGGAPSGQAGGVTGADEGILGSVWSAIKGLAGDASTAGDEIKRGGEAARAGGEQAGAAMERGARALDAAFRNLPGAIAGAVRNASGGRNTSGNVGPAVSTMKNGSLSGGTE